MRALILERPGRVTAQDIPPPSGPGPEQVLLRTGCVGVCFSEKHWFDGIWTQSNDLRALWNQAAPPHQPGLWGHEFGGVVEEVGDRVSSLQPGDRVAVMPWKSCGECLMCRAGHHAGCSSATVSRALAESCVLEESQCYPVPASISDVAAALVEPMASATRPARLGFLSPGQHVVFFGAEDYNLAQVQWARIAGATHRIVVDPVAIRRRAAERCGATLTVDPAVDDPSEILRDLLPVGADIVFVSTEDYIPAAAQYLVHAFNVVRRGGEVVINRCFGPGPWAIVDPLVPWFKEVTIRNVGLTFSSEPALGGPARDDYQMTIDYLATGELSIDPYEPEVLDFWSLEDPEDFTALFARLPEEHVKLVVRVGREDATGP